VRQLNAGRRALLPQKRGDARQEGDVLVFPDAVILRRNAAARFHRRRFHDHQRGAAHRAASEVDQMPVVGEPVLARVLAHGRDRNAIAEREFADCERSKKSGHVPVSQRQGYSPQRR
jgi:hypothetical protein